MEPFRQLVKGDDHPDVKGQDLHNRWRSGFLQPVLKGTIQCQPSFRMEHLCFPEADGRELGAAGGSQSIQQTPFLESEPLRAQQPPQPRAA